MMFFLGGVVEGGMGEWVAGWLCIKKPRRLEVGIGFSDQEGFGFYRVRKRQLFYTTMQLLFVDTQYLRRDGRRLGTGMENGQNFLYRPIRVDKEEVLRDIYS